MLKPHLWTRERFFVAIPPVFDASTGRIAEALMRWLAEATPMTAPVPDVSDLPSKLYDEAAAGRGCVMPARATKRWTCCMKAL